jgi:hypothetical protein
MRTAGLAGTGLHPSRGCGVTWRAGTSASAADMRVIASGDDVVFARRRDVGRNGDASSRESAEPSRRTLVARHRLIGGFAHPSCRKERGDRSHHRPCHPPPSFDEADPSRNRTCSGHSLAHFTKIASPDLDASRPVLSNPPFFGYRWAISIRIDATHAVPMGRGDSWTATGR